MALTINSKIKLNNGVEMPLLGFGTFRAEGKDSRRSVREAIDAGYIHIDTALIYGNEEDVGRGIKDSGISRDKLFVTTKLWIADQGYDSSLKAIEKSLKNLQLDYVDLYLIHWPVEEKLHETWRAMEEIQRKGLSRAVGVSNYTIRLLEDLKKESDYIPSVNQVEFTPFLYQKELLDYCQNNGICLEAYSPLTRGKKLDDSRLVKVAEKHGKSTAQVLLRWDLQHEIVTIPKTVTSHRIIENADLYDFQLDHEDMTLLDSLNEDARMIHPANHAPPEW
ncbi:MAG: aldo/keto reductase [Anaerolineaceae bacterium]|nr:aldo/keto reductase [Anaerolineaceae bacterium]